MVNYELDFSDEGKISFSSLDKAVAQRILNKLKWLTQNIEAISPLPLKWNYEGLYKLRIGDWRVIYDVNHGVSEKGGKNNSGDYTYLKTANGQDKLDKNGHLIVDHDLHNHNGELPDGIAEAFIEFAKSEGLSFWK